MDKYLHSREAMELINSDAYKHAYERTRKDIAQTWENTLDPAKRESLWHMLKALALVQKALVADAALALQEEANAKAQRPR
jgi:hypothetical protein